MEKKPIKVLIKLSKPINHAFVNYKWLFSVVVSSHRLIPSAAVSISDDYARFQLKWKKYFALVALLFRPTLHFPHNLSHSDITPQYIPVAGMVHSQTILIHTYMRLPRIIYLYRKNDVRLEKRTSKINYLFFPFGRFFCASKI